MNHPLVTIIVGNTHTSCQGWSCNGVAIGENTWLTADALAQRATIDYEKIFGGLLAEMSTVFVLGGVVPRYQPQLRDWLAQHGYGVKAFRTEILPRIEIIPQPPENVGDDRIAAALGALALHPDTPAVVVDAGTALTVNAVTPSVDGALPRFEGGVIMPGQELMLSALSSNTARLPHVDEDPNRESAEHIGRSTEQAMRWGAWHAYSQGALASAFGQVRALGKGARVILTGGGAPALAPAFRTAFRTAAPVEVQPQLVHRGLFAAFQDSRA